MGRTCRSASTARASNGSDLLNAVYEPLVRRVQFARPQPDISKVATHDHTNDRTGQQSRQAPLQYYDLTETATPIPP
jgi:hypothetical protein